MILLALVTFHYLDTRIIKIVDICISFNLYMLNCLYIYLNIKCLGNDLYPVLHTVWKPFHFRPELGAQGYTRGGTLRRGNNVISGYSDSGCVSPRLSWTFIGYSNRRKSSSFPRIRKGVTSSLFLVVCLEIKLESFPAIY